MTIGKVLTTTLGYGKPGQKAGEDNIVESYVVASGSAVIKYGEPVVLAGFRTVESMNTTTLTMSNFVGIALRPFNRMNENYSTAGKRADDTGYSAGETIDVLVLGKAFVNVPTAASLSALGGSTVYTFIAEGSAGAAEAIGTFNEAADSSNTLELTNCSWAEDVSSKLAVLRIKTRNI